MNLKTPVTYASEKLVPDKTALEPVRQVRDKIEANKWLRRAEYISIAALAGIGVWAIRSNIDTSLHPDATRHATDAHAAVNIVGSGIEALGEGAAVISLAVFGTRVAIRNRRQEEQQPAVAYETSETALPIE